MIRSSHLPLLTLVLAAFACAPTAETPSRAVSQAELTARTLMSVWESGDTRDLARLFRPEAVYEDFSNQAEYRGIEEIAGYVGNVNSWATDLSLYVGSVHAGASGATVEWAMSGIQDRPIRGLLGTATNREFFINGVTIVELEDGLIRRAADYIDVAPLLLQLGATITLPDGEVMRLDGPEGE